MSPYKWKDGQIMKACDDYLFKQRCPGSCQMDGKDITCTDYDGLFLKNVKLGSIQNTF